MRRKKTYAFLLLLLAVFSRGQNMHFSQFSENHALVNPALTGATDPMRATVAYRDQWRSVSTPYKTFGVSFETQMNTSGWKEVDKFRSMTFKERSIGRLAWGLSVFSDRAGAANLATTLGNLSVASFIPFNQKNFLSIGLQASIAQKNLSTGNLVYPSQFNGSGYDPALPQNERVSTTSYVYFGFAGGCAWSYGRRDKRVGSNRQLKANAGCSFYQVTIPQPGFFADAQTLKIRYVAHGDLLYQAAHLDLGIAPSFFMQVQGTSMELIAGAMVRFYMAENSKYTGNVKQSSIGLGFYYRNSDAFITTLSFEVSEQYAVGISYDVNTSRLSNASTGRGSLELTLRYTPPRAFLYQKKAKITK